MNNHIKLYLRMYIFSDRDLFEYYLDNYSELEDFAILVFTEVGQCLKYLEK